MLKKIYNILTMILLQCVVYMIMFILYPFSAKFLGKVIATILMIAEVLVIYLYSAYKMKFSVLARMIGIIPLWFLAAVYHSHQLFGIGDGRFGFDVFPAYLDALIFSIIMFIIQNILFFIMCIRNKCNNKK